MIDCSHGNSGKDYRRQREVVANAVAQRAVGNVPITGVMIESHLVEGRQDCREPAALVYGQSITDACVGWDETVELLHTLAGSVGVASLLTPQGRTPDRCGGDGCQQARTPAGNPTLP